MGEDRLGDRLEVLRPLGIEAATIRALGELPVHDRALLVALDVERLDPRDVALIVASDDSEVGRAAESARRAFVRAYARLDDLALPSTTGPRVARIRSAANMVVQWR